ncbi:MAG: chain length-determining protein [Nitrospiraceae bacterium]|nr:MAG: chain length-determining protein [Nitrospiraceae bacterium]
MNDSAQMDIEKYWRIVAGRKYLFIAVSLLCLSIVVWGSYFVPEIYEAQCTVLIERNVINALVKDITVTPSIEERLRVLSYTMTSRTLLLKVIADLDLDVNGEDQAGMEKLVKNFQENTVIKMVNKGGKEADWFSVTYRDRDPKVARDYINTLVRRYVEENVSAKREESSEANRFLGEQRKFFKDKLDELEEKIMTFRRNKGIFIAIDEKTIVGDIKTAHEILEALKIQKMELEAKKKLTEKQLKEEKPYTVAMLGRMKGDSVNDRMLTLQNKLNDLLVKYTENYPEVIKIKAEIETLKMQTQARPAASGEDVQQGGETEMTTLNPLHQKLKEELSKFDSDLAAIAAKERHLSGLLETKKEYLRNIPMEKKGLSDLERERDNLKKIDDELVLKLGQSEVSKQMEIQDKAETFRIIDPAILPAKPVSPNRVVIILAGIIVGIACGFGAVLLLYNMDSSVKSVDELKSLFKTPVLAVIPRIVTEAELIKKKKTDRMVYGASIAYLLVICALFVKELIGRLL